MTDPLAALTGARDERISEIFYYFEQLTTISSGRTVGRKIGVVQETLLRKYLEQDEHVRRRMYLEQFLTGISGAAHKVEFSFHPLTTAAGLAENDEVPGTEGVLVSKVSPGSESLYLGLGAGAPQVLVAPERPIPKKGPLRDHLARHQQDIRVVAVGPEGVTLDVVDRSRLLASLESKRVGAQRFAGSDKLGAGIQTIEKAKQASLVAIDLDLLHNGNVKPLQPLDAPKQLISIVALGNGVHWTEKDKAVLGTFVDFTWLVRDEAIVRYAEFVRHLAGDTEDFLPFFMDYFKGMTVQQDDDFEVYDDDFSIIVPGGESRSLLDIIRGHIVAVDAN